VATRVAIELADARGFRYTDLDDDLLERGRRWLAEGVVPEGQQVRERRVYRWGDLAIKFFPLVSKPRLRDRFRPSAAVRSADTYRRIRPVPSPRPRLALEAGDGASLLVYDWVDGDSVDVLWGVDEAAIAALPAFLASMHERRVFHGDFHVHNFVWDGEAWVLLDLVGVRHALRSFARGRRLAIDHWAYLLWGLDHHAGADEAEVRPLFDEYTRLSPTLAPRDWRKVVRGWRGLLRRAGQL
jgi:hypothetical protein